MSNTYLDINKNSNIEVECTSDLHFTYNPLKKEFLKERGLMYISTGINNNTGKKFWTYKKGELLDYALKLWRKHQEDRHKE